jgi:outer membrane protein assembly factor BamB
MGVGITWTDCKYVEIEGNLTMTAAFILVFTSVLFSGALTWLLSSAPGCEERCYYWRRPGTYRTWTGLSLLLVFLSACSGGTTGQITPTVTPLTLTEVPQQKATPTAKPAAAASSTNWTTYHLNNQRTGYVASAPDPHSLSRTWQKSLDGAVYAEPLVVDKHVIVATEGDSLYSLNPATGSVQWRTNVGAPVPLSSLPCGNIDPLGITGTPVYDPASGLVFAVAEVSGPAHILVGVDVKSGQVKVRRLLDTDGMDPRAHQQRGALTLAHGMVYTTYGGLAGDCSDYIGRVVASRTDGRGALLVYRVPTPREGGIWQPAGASLDKAGNLFISVGNGAITQGHWDHSDSILRLSPRLQLEDAFAPTGWPNENANDQDLGSQGPVLLPGNFVFTAGKSGKAYVLRANALGGVGGQVDVQDVCTSFGGAATVGSTIFVPCTSGVRQVSVDAGGRMHLGWHASGISGSPVVGGHTVYSLSNGMLYSLNMKSGQAVTSLNVGQTNRFATPTISGASIYIGTLNGITAVKIS